MNYVTEMYLNYLDYRDVYQEIYNTFAIKYFMQEAMLDTRELRALLAQKRDYLNKLVQHKKNLIDKGMDKPQIMNAIDAKIKATGSSIGKIQGDIKNAPLPPEYRHHPRGTEPPPPGKKLEPGELPAGARTAPRGQSKIDTTVNPSGERTELQ